jgi:hypothetical protein
MVLLCTAKLLCSLWHSTVYFPTVNNFVQHANTQSSVQVTQVPFSEREYWLINFNQEIVLFRSVFEIWSPINDIPMCRVIGLDRTLQSRGWHSCFLFNRSSVQISAQRPAILTEVFHGFSQSLQANSGIVPWSRLLPSTYFPVHYSLIYLSLDAI